MHVITGLGQGGAEGVLSRLVLADRANRHLIVSLAGEGRYGDELRRKGISVIPLGLPRGPGALLGVFQICRVIAQFRPQVVQTWMYHADLLGGLAGRIAGVPVVWNLRNSVVQAGKTNWGTRLVVRLNSLLSRLLPAHILCNAHPVIDIHRRAGFSVRRMRVIPNGFDTSRFRPFPRTQKPARRGPRRIGHRPILGMVARWDPYKDHETLFRGLQILKESGEPFRCLLAGAGMTTTNSELMRMIRGRNLSKMVFLLGPQDDIPKILNRLDLHVLSSSAEAFPNVLGEAMACGVPCVTTDVGNAAKIVGDTGWVVPPSDPRALADALARGLRAMRDRRAWRARKKQARMRICRHYGLPAMVRVFRRVWTETAVVV